MNGETFSELNSKGEEDDDLSFSSSKALNAIRRKENMLKAIALSSDELISNPDIYNAIDKSLPYIGKSVDVDRVYLFRSGFSEDNKTVSSQILEWNSGSSSPQIDNPELQNLSLELIDGFLNELLQKKSFIAKLSEVAEGSLLRHILESEDIKSILIIPIFVGDQFWGYLGFDECKYERSWAEDEISILKNFSNTISLAIDRAAMTEDIASNIAELKRTQTQLERLSLVASTNRQGVHFTGPDFKIIYVNKALINLTGYEEDEMLGKTPPELFHGPLTQSDSIIEIRDKTDLSEPTDVDIILYRKDRSWFWANVKKQPVARNETGAQEFFSIIEDITEKKQAIENLRNSQSLLALLIDNLKSGILLEDENRRLVVTNNSFCSMFGIPARPSEMIGADCQEAFKQVEFLFTNPEEANSRIHQIITEKQVVLSEEIPMNFGQYFERDYIPLFVDEKFKGHLWKYNDLTERKNQEKTLKNQEEKYRNLIANMKMGLIETDNNDIIHYANQQFCEMTGYTPEEIIGKRSIELLVADEFKQRVKEKNSLRSEGLSDIYQIQIKLKNGDLRWWLTSGGPNYNDKGKLIGTVGISVDVTEQKELEQELEIARQKAEESSKAKEAFLSNMSHEIRTPLNAVIGMIRELSREPLSPRQSAYMKNAGLASHQLLSIVNNILDITKIESGQINLDLRPFCLSDVINDTISILSVSAQEKMLKLSAVNSPQLAPAYIGDANRISQILLNLLGNSIKFTETGTVSVECTVTGTDNNFHNIRIKISDSGIGIEESFIKNIFEKFSMGDFSAARKHGGSGLGMAITYQLVKLMNGSIEVVSTRGTGTTIVIDLRLEIGNEKEIDITTNTKIFDDLTDIKILLVEDNDLNRLVAHNSLSFHNMKVTEAINGIEAIEKLKKESFDLILMDLQMPEMGGIDATRVIREEMKLNTPIIALTANAFKAEIDRCINAGMNDYIIKPFEENILIGAIIKNIITSDKKQEAEINEEKPGTETKLYDLEPIFVLSRGNKEFVGKIVRIFIDDMPVGVNQIKTAWNAKDFNTLRSVAHRIKPNIDNFGITSLSQDIRTIESLAAEGVPSDELKNKINRLDEIIKTVVEKLTAEFY
jgi:PAS domain S-box-containing protein